VVEGWYGQPYRQKVYADQLHKAMLGFYIVPGRKPGISHEW
jgi:hypothetical protein